MIDTSFNIPAVLGKRIPYAKWEMVEQMFSSANVDWPIAHTLAPLVPSDVKFEVVDADAGGVVYRGKLAPASDYIVLQATVIGTYRIRLFIEAATKE